MGESILWRGSASSLTIYDKEREINKRKVKNGEILRIELRLKGAEGIKASFGKPSLRNLDYFKCYEVFREAVLKLTPPSIPKLRGIADIYRIAVKERWTISGLPILTWLDGKFVGQHRNRIARYNSSLLLKQKIDLEEQFPLSKPHPVRTTKSGFDYSKPAKPAKAKFRYSPSPEKTRHLGRFTFRKT
jgi:hypothetical protein